MIPDENIEGLIIEDSRDEYLLSKLDYFIIDGVIYTTDRNDFQNNLFIKKVAEL